MKVILKKDVLKLGRAGDIKQVRDGYARNYLMPKGLVVEATEGAVRAWKSGEDRRAKRRAQEDGVLKELAKKISGVTLSFSRPVSEEGVMFGSVAKSDILKSLKAADIEVHKDSIQLPASIKAVGNHEVEIALKSDISAKVKIVVTAQTK